MDHCPNISNQGLEYICTYGRSLKTISLIYCSGISSRGLEELGQNPSPSLSYVDVSYCKNISQNDVFALSHALGQTCTQPVVLVHKVCSHAGELQTRHKLGETECMM